MDDGEGLVISPPLRSWKLEPGMLTGALEPSKPVVGGEDNISIHVDPSQVLLTCERLKNSLNCSNRRYLKGIVNSPILKENLQNT